MLCVFADGLEETCGAAVARPEAVLVVLSSAPAPSLRAENLGKEPETNQDAKQRPASVRKRATQFEALVAVDENVKQPFG